MNQTTTENVSIHEWRFFIESIRLHSFAAVARKYKTDPVYVSRCVKRLESTIGKTLLIRSKRGLFPTWDGEQYYSHIGYLINDIDALFTTDTLKKEPARIRIAIPSSLAPLLFRWISEYSRTSTIQSTIEVVQYEKAEPPSVNGFDLFVCMEKLPLSRVFAQSIGFVKKGIFVRAQDAKQYGTMKHPEQLLEKKLFSTKPEITLINGEDQITLNTHCALICNNELALLDMAKYANGCLIGLPLWTNTDSMPKKDLVRILPQWECVPDSVWLVRPERKYIDKQVEEIVMFIRESWTKTEGLEYTHDNFNVQLAFDRLL